MSSINYSELILEGFFIENNRKYLSNYFFRESKAANDKGYEFEEFYSGINIVLRHWEDKVKRKVIERKKELHLMLSEAKNKTLAYSDLDGKSIEQKRKDTISFCEGELSHENSFEIGNMSFSIDLNKLTNGKVIYSLNRFQFNSIIEAVKEAESRTKTPFVDKSKQESSKTYDTIFEIINGIDGDKGWEYAFRSREDLDKFIELLTCFFEQRKYKLPDEVIRLRKGSKTRMATRVNEIYKELSDRPLKGDNEFLDILRILHPFSHTSDLYKTISR
ncbi:hypothetical protein OAF64_02950 [Crocinitomicaceae bacterium]|nr:hypothetical protein [Crocinitomicaceae bacterium]